MEVIEITSKDVKNKSVNEIKEEIKAKVMIKLKEDK